MNHTKIIKLGDGRRIEVRVSVYLSDYRSDYGANYHSGARVCGKGKRTFLPVQLPDLNINEHLTREMLDKIVQDAKIELWQQLKPKEV